MVKQRVRTALLTLLVSGMAVTGSVFGIPGAGGESASAATCYWHIATRHKISGLYWVRAVYYCGGVPVCAYDGWRNPAGGYECASVYLEPR